MSAVVPDRPLWPTRSRRLPRLVGVHRADVCVVGLGGGGLTAIETLIASGRRVIGVDAEGVGAGAAGRNGGLLLAGTAEPYHRLTERVGEDGARALYELSLEARDRMMADVAGADPRGGLLLPASHEEREDLLGLLEALGRAGFAGQWWSGEDPTQEGLLIPGDGIFDPGRRCQALADRVAHRAELFGGSPVTSIGPERVQTASGEVRAETVVVLVDGGLERIIAPWAEAAGGDRPAVRSLRLQMLATAPATDVRLPFAVYHRFGFDYWHQAQDGRIVLGGARDRGGASEETSTRGITPEVQRTLDTLLRQRVRTKAAVTHRWSGIVGYTEDRLPLVDEVPEIGAGVFAAGGYSGHGNVLSSLAGEALAALALGRSTPALVGWLRSARRTDTPTPGESGPRSRPDKPIAT